MSEPAPVQPTRPGAAEADDSDLPVTPAVERIIREWRETFDEDAKAARPWEDVLADLKRTLDGSVVVACLHHRQQPEIAKARALGREPS